MALTKVGVKGLDDGTDGQVITYDANGNPVAVGPGTDGQVLTSTGAGSPPAFEDASGTTINNNADNRVITGSGTAGTLNGESNVHIDGGYLIVGHSATTTTSNGESPFVQIKAPDSRAGASFIRHSADAAGSGLYIGKSRNGTIGSNTVVQDDDELGRITFSGDDGTDVNTVGAEIAAHVDGTPGSNDMPGRLTFRTTADGAASTTERMRIDSAGYIGIGETAPLAQVHIKPATNITQLLLEQNNATDGYGLFQDGPNGGHLKFMRHVNGSETQKLLLRNDGGLCFGTDSAAANALDDYEEGTWDPIARNGIANAAYTVQDGYYTKVGNIVHCTFTLQWGSGCTTNGGHIMLGNAPFTVASSPHDDKGVGLITYQNMESTGYGLYIHMSGARLDLYVGSTNGWTMANATDMNGKWIKGGFTYRAA